MLQIALALRAVGPLVLHHRLVATCLSRLWRFCRFGLALAGAALMYALALVATVLVIPSGLALGHLLHGGCVGLATMLAVLAAAWLAPRPLQNWATVATTLLAASFPAGLYAHAVAQGDWRPVHLWYFGVTLAGSLAAAHIRATMARMSRAVIA